MLSLGRDAPAASLEIIALDQLTLWTVTGELFACSP